mgnify:CR=1 FL=1
MGGEGSLILPHLKEDDLVITESGIIILIGQITRIFSSALFNFGVDDLLDIGLLGTRLPLLPPLSPPPTLSLFPLFPLPPSSSLPLHPFPIYVFPHPVTPLYHNFCSSLQTHKFSQKFCP